LFLRNKIKHDLVEITSNKIVINYIDKEKFLLTFFEEFG